MRRGGGLYGNFVSSNDEVSKPYRGAEIPPPSSLSSSAAKRPNGGHQTPGISKHGYSTISSISSKAQVHADPGEIGPKRAKTEEEYFDEDNDDDPAPSKAPDSAQQGSDSDEDPLDAFMANLEKDAEAQASGSGAKGSASSTGASTSSKAQPKGVRGDIDDMDDEESYYKWLEENPNAGRPGEEDEVEIEYDADGNPIVPPKPKYIDPLPPLDHSKIEYEPFDKDFYKEHIDIQGLSPVQIIDLRNKLGVRVAGAQAPKPVSSFGHFNLDEPLMKAIRKAEFSQPTPIQAQAIPALLSGRDCIGVAKTGSGKTVAFLWPMLTHIAKQRPLLKGDGPVGLILVPTRELALQIYSEAKKFGKVYNFKVVCAYGGGSKWEQSKAFETGAEIAIATPGRMIDMIKMKVTNLERVTYLVLDEADRMFDMGFEPQVGVNNAFLYII